MNLLKLAPAFEQFAAAAGEPAVTLDGDRCVRHWNQNNSCHQCAAGCPTAAIALTPGGVEYTADACAACGYCLHACPTGAFSGKDETAKLLQSAAAVAPCSALDLACGCFPTAQSGQDVDAIMQVSGCLAALGPAAYVGLAAMGSRRLGLHLEACAGCPIGALRVQIERVAAEAAQLGSMEISVYECAPAEQARKPVHTTRSPQYSRRGLLQRCWVLRPPQNMDCRRWRRHRRTTNPHPWRAGPCSTFLRIYLTSSACLMRISLSLLPAQAVLRVGSVPPFAPPVRCRMNRKTAVSPCTWRRLPAPIAACARNSVRLEPYSPPRLCPMLTPIRPS